MCDDKNDVVASCLGALINLCALSDNAKAFMSEDGMNYLNTLLQNPDVSEKSRTVAARILQNIASDAC